MPTNAIGPFTFITLSQPPPLVKEQLLRHARPGVDGVTLHRTGVRGMSFTCDSRAGALTIGQAYDLYDGYVKLIGAAAVAVTWSTLTLAVKAHLYYVLDVELVRCDAIVRGQGPSGPYYAEVDCRWTLQPIRPV